MYYTAMLGEVTKNVSRPKLYKMERFKKHFARSIMINKMISKVARFMTCFWTTWREIQLRKNTIIWKRHLHFCLWKLEYRTSVYASVVDSLKTMFHFQISFQQFEPCIDKNKPKNSPEQKFFSVNSSEEWAKKVSIASIWKICYSG